MVEIDEKAPPVETRSYENNPGLFSNLMSRLVLARQSIMSTGSLEQLGR